jgi:hypothetical protein
MEDFDDYDEEEVESQQVMSYLLNAGAANLAGLDEDGEPLFTFNMKVLKEVLPDLYETIMEDIDNTMMELYQKGLVELEYDENLNAKFSISEEAKTILQTLGFEDLINDEDEDF